MKEAPSYTVAEVAPRLCPGGSERERYQVARKVQNWVTAGLVKPVAGSGEGRGVHRRYDRHEAGKAAVLLELQQYGLPWRTLEIAAGVFDDARDPKTTPRRKGLRSQEPTAQRKKLSELVRSAFAGRKTVYLKLWKDRATDKFEAHFGQDHRVPPTARSVVSVNITRVLSELKLP